MTRAAAHRDSGPVPSGRPSRLPTDGLHYYRVFGHGLSSEVELPELEPVDVCTPRWAFRLLAAGEASSGGRLLGEEPLYGDVSARLYRHAAGYRIEVDDTGIYDLTSDGARIGWLPNPEPWWDFGRGHLLGRVLATAMHFSGQLVLHGSAVATGGVVAFLGEKGAGKSSLALALVRQGARLVTDDTLPLAVEAGCMAWPGVHSIRLRPDMASPDLMGGKESSLPGRDGKLTTAPLDSASVLDEPAPLRAIYLVQPAISTDPARSVQRFELDPVRAAAAITGFAKIGVMLGPGEAGSLLERAAAVAGTVPVYVLAVHRAAEELEHAAKEILAWHTPATAGG